MTTTTYQFGTVTDAQSVWTNEANLKDGNDGTAASTTTLESGTNNRAVVSALASLANTGYIGAVRMRIHGTNGGAGNTIYHYIVKVSSTTVFDSNHTFNGVGQAVVLNLAAPTANGWRWSDLANLTVDVGLASLSTGGALNTIEIQVLTFAYRWPIMVGNNVSLAVGSDRALPINASNDAAWSTTLKVGETCAPCDLAFGRMFIDLSAAPGAGGPETFAIWAANVLQEGSVDIRKQLATTDSDVSDDGKATVCLAPGETARMNVGRSASVTNASLPTRFMTYVAADSFPVFASSGGNVATSTTVHTAFQDGGPTPAGTAKPQVCPIAGTISKLYVKKLEAALSSGTAVITLQKNGSDTSLSVTVDSTGGDSTHTVFSDTNAAHDVSVVAGDTLGWKIVTTSMSALSSFAIAACFDSDTPGKGLLLGGNTTNPGTPATYSNWYGPASWNTTEANRQALGGRCQITDMYVLLGTQPGVGKTRTITLRKNGSATNLAVTIVDTATTGSDAATDVIIDELDLLSIESTTTGTPNSSGVRYGLAYQAVLQTLTISEQINITDTPSVATTYNRTLPTEQINITDDVDVNIGAGPPVDHTRTVNDGIDITDYVVVNPRKIVDVVEITDFGTVEIVSPDTVLITDQVTLQMALQRLITDQVNISETLIITPTHWKPNFNDEVRITDAVTVFIAPSIADIVIAQVDKVQPTYFAYELEISGDGMQLPQESTSPIKARIRAKIQGQEVDMSVYVVKAAVLPQGQIPQDSDFKAATWDIQNVTGMTTRYRAEIEVGPTTAVGTLDRTKQYRMHVRIGTSPFKQILVPGLIEVV